MAVEDCLPDTQEVDPSGFVRGARQKEAWHVTGAFSKRSIARADA